MSADGCGAAAAALTPVGFWRAAEGDADDARPWPRAASCALPAAARELMLRYLTAHGMVESYEHGAARCRLGCARPLGCAALTDGVFVWPEGFAHYVAAHGAGVPRALLAAARTAAGVAEGDEAAGVAARGGLAAALPPRNHLLYDPVARAGAPLPRGTREWLRSATDLELP
jgi:hypothetical protein